MQAYLWIYRVKAELIDDFAHAYGPCGEWSEFFRRSPRYIRTELLCDAHAKDQFMTIDYFADSRARAALIDSNVEEYALIDEKWREATLEEAFLGEFELLGK